MALYPEDLAKTAYRSVSIGRVTEQKIEINGSLLFQYNIFKVLVTKTFCVQNKCAEILAYDDQQLSDFEKAFNAYFFNLAKLNKRKEKEQTVQGSKFGDGIAYRTLLPVVDVETNTRKLLNPHTNSISNISYEVWETSLDKESRGSLLAEKVNAVLVYDPYNLGSCILIPYEGLGNVLKINTYVPPEWRKQELTDSEFDNLHCPELIEKLLLHLFPDPDCLEYVLSWLHHALVARNETYLVLNSAKGVGKGIFAQLLRSLVGQEHYTEAHRGFLESQFNSLLANRRLVVLDEISVNTAEKVNRLKSYINRYQNLEGKYKNAEKVVELYTSFVISNNSTSDMHLECDDRRFSVPDITEEPLTKTLTTREISELIDRVENDLEFQRQFGFWVLHHCASDIYDAFSVWKGKKYHELVYSSLPEWSKFLVDLLNNTSEPFFTHKDLQRLYQRDTGNNSQIMAGRSKISDFLKNYKVGDLPVGYATTKDGLWGVCPRVVNTDLVSGIEDYEID